MSQTDPEFHGDTINAARHAVITTAPKTNQPRRFQDASTIGAHINSKRKWKQRGRDNLRRLMDRYARADEAVAHGQAQRRYIASQGLRALKRARYRFTRWRTLARSFLAKSSQEAGIAVASAPVVKIV